MGSLAIIGIAFSLSMDAFAASISSGCSMPVIKKRFVFYTAGSFGLFQGLMPVIGYIAGLSVHSHISRWEHWAAFGLLLLIGSKMIYEGIQEGKKAGCEDPDDVLFSFTKLMSMSLATSIDAFLIGVSFAVLGYPIAFPALIIGFVTFIVSIIGVLTGRFLKHVFSEFVEIIGGIILILLGIHILLSHIS